MTALLRIQTDDVVQVAQPNTTILTNGVEVLVPVGYYIATDPAGSQRIVTPAEYASVYSTAPGAGAANGLATLNSARQVPIAELPTNTLGGVPLLDPINGALRLDPAMTAGSASAGGNGLVPGNVMAFVTCYVNVGGTITLGKIPVFAV